ncbi:MAG: glycosyltransferase family 9 protein [Gemmatimonadaceae bacterium]
MRTLVIQTSFLGDMVLTTPLLARLAESDEVDVVGTPAAIALLANHPAVQERIPYDKRGVHRGIAGFSKVGMQLRHRRYDRALLAQGSARSGALAMAAGIRERIGFDTSAGRSFYTTRIPYVENEHHALRLLRLSGDTRSAAPRPRLFPGGAERDAVDVLVKGVGDEPLIGLAPGSVWPTKRWPGYAALAQALVARGRLVIIGSVADGELAQRISAVAPARVIDATGKLSLLASAELIRRCRVLVTNDSAPQHLASAVNTPTVTIFGPTVPAFGFGPLAEPSITLGLDSLPCRPCDKHGPVSCPLGHWKCMRELGVQEVVRAIEKLTG